MTEHPITPPPELVQQWTDEAWKGWRGNGTYERDLTAQAAQWGADQELEECCEHLKRIWSPSDTIDSLRAVRRPKPPSLKEQALAVIENSLVCDHLNPQDEAIIRRALEQLDD